MIEDKNILVTYADENGEQQEITIAVTGAQIGQTVRRRIETLLPKARIFDMKDKTVGLGTKGQQLKPGAAK